MRSAEKAAFLILDPVLIKYSLKMLKHALTYFSTSCALIPYEVVRLTITWEVHWIYEMTLI